MLAVVCSRILLLSFFEFHFILYIFFLRYCFLCFIFEFWTVYSGWQRHAFLTFSKQIFVAGTSLIARCYTAIALSKSLPVSSSIACSLHTACPLAALTFVLRIFSSLTRSLAILKVRCGLNRFNPVSFSTSSVRLCNRSFVWEYVKNKKKILLFNIQVSGIVRQIYSIVSIYMYIAREYAKKTTNQSI